ncbi:MAG: cation-translocating P-type ATPase [Cyclobacteriaceae bacterium]|nr:cation-translocating P-type ATPase [Cyclobacteriaceae bacterium]
MSYHIKSLEDITAEFNTGSGGIHPASVPERQKQYGRNLLVIKKKKTFLQMLFGQLTDFMIIILIVASVVSGFIGEMTDAYVIIAIVIINTVIGLLQERNAEHALEALEKIVITKASVIRNGETIEIPASELLPGDLVVMEAGNIIPADLRFIEVHALKVDESSLTGESSNVSKITASLPHGDYPLGDRINLGYNGTMVTSGRGTAYVVATGMKTEIGRIASMIQQGNTRTPLQLRLDAFSKRLTIAILLLCIVFFFIGILRGGPWSIVLLTAISLAVAAIPEALPAVSTIVLARGARQLVKQNVLVRKLPAVETLGSITYICSDKTGTLTMNKMEVTELYEPDLGAGYNHYLPGKNLLLTAMALNTDVVSNQHGELTGESTELGLAQFAAAQHYNRSALEKELPRIAELPFDPSRRCMTTLHGTSDGVIAFVKGSVEVLLEKLAHHQDSERSFFQEKANKMASQGYRVLGYAVKRINTHLSNINIGEVEQELTFIGIAAMMDPTREEAKEAIAQCKAAGVTAVMITGDHKLTATSVAERLGIISSEKDLVLEGHELRQLSEQQFMERVEHIRVYARVNPDQKLRIIKALRERHQFIAMTGDGVNDAPALRNADIGIAMGRTGTEVAKEAAHMILLDDNFATIVKAIRQGRRIFDNILKFIKYIMTGNTGEIATLFVASLAGLPIPLLPVHILWVNLLTDGLPGLALSSEPAEENIMQRNPRDPRQGIFSTALTRHIIFYGLLTGAVTLLMQIYTIAHHDSAWQTMTFSVLCFSQLSHLLAIKSGAKSFFQTNHFANKPMMAAIAVTIAAQLMVIYVPGCNAIFKTQPLSLYEMTLVIVFSLVIFAVVEIEKLLRYCFNRSASKR